MRIKFTATVVTTLMINGRGSQFVRAFSVATSARRHLCTHHLSRYTSTSHTTPAVPVQQQTSIARNSGGSRTNRSSSMPSVGRNKMVLRPDWERDGRVFGLSPQVLKDKEQARTLAEGLLEQEQQGKSDERAFEYLVSYPCDFEIKVIGINEGSFADDIAATVSTACEVEANDVRYTTRDTNSGKYQSITLLAPVKNAKMLYRCYEVIDMDPRVKFKF